MRGLWSVSSRSEMYGYAARMIAIRGLACHPDPPPPSIKPYIYRLPEVRGTPAEEAVRRRGTFHLSPASSPH